MIVSLAILTAAVAQPVQVDTTVVGAEQSSLCITVDVAPVTRECRHVQTVVTREVLRGAAVPASPAVAPARQSQPTQARSTPSAPSARPALPAARLQRQKARAFAAPVPAGFIQPVSGIVGFGVTPVGLVSPEDIVPVGSMGAPVRPL